MPNSRHPCLHGSMENTKLRRVNRHAQDYTINGGEGTRGLILNLGSHHIKLSFPFSHHWLPLSLTAFARPLGIPTPKDVLIPLFLHSLDLEWTNHNFFDNKNTALPTCLSMTYMIFSIFGRSAHMPPSSQSWGNSLSPSSSELYLPVSPLLVSTSIFHVVSPLTLYTSHWVVYAYA